jgi:hypothetical protein
MGQSFMNSPRISVSIVALAFLTTATAQVPQIISYQGRVAVTGTNFDGTGQFRFALVSSNASTTYWTNDGNSPPVAAVPLTVTKGLYSVLLGDVTISNMTQAIPPSVFSNSDVRLRVWFNDAVHGSQQLAPDQRIAAVGYAMVAATVPDGSITSSKIATGAVTSAQLADGIAIGSRAFYTNGTFVVPATVNFVFVTLVGGGGGGGAGDQLIGIDNYGGGGGGAGGIVLNHPVLVTPGASYSITIGAGGAGAPSGQTGGSPYWSGHSGSSGGDTSFGSLIYARGGGGGSGATGINEGGGGAGGDGGLTTTAPSLANLGYTGQIGGSRGGDGSFLGGVGASSPFGSGGAAASGANANGVDATAYGAGGGGGAPSNDGNGTGGNGSPGFAIIRY